MYGALILACVVFFWAAVPLLLMARARLNAPWWFVIAAATGAGWMLANAAVFFQQAGTDEERVEELACFEHPESAANNPEVLSENETEVVNPCGIGDWIPAHYKPVRGLLYGPLYLVGCALPYWLIFGRRSAPGLTRRIVWLAVAALVIEWAATVGECIHPLLFGQVCPMTDPYVYPPVTIALAFLLSWIIATQVLERFDRRHNARSVG